MRIMAVDDEQLVRDNLMKIIHQVVPEAEIVGFDKPETAFDYLLRNKVDIAFLDIEMGKLNGITLAKKCKDICPTVNIIFVTGYSQYMMEAFELHASGYLMKPVRASDLHREIDDLRHPVLRASSQRVQVKTFGGFDVFVDGVIISFGRAKAKEVLAYLVNKRGISSTTREIAAVLWEDEKYDFAKQRYFQTIVSDLIATLKTVGAEDIIIRKRNSLAVDPVKFECDFYSFQKGDIQAVNTYTGEYMSNYSWAEFTLGYLEKIKANQ